MCKNSEKARKIIKGILDKDHIEIKMEDYDY